MTTLFLSTVTVSLSLLSLVNSPVAPLGRSPLTASQVPTSFSLFVSALSAHATPARLTTRAAAARKRVGFIEPLLRADLLSRRPAGALSGCYRNRRAAGQGGGRRALC